MAIERGWFYLADLNPPHGTEPGTVRPVLVVQTDLLNQHNHPSTLVIPTTTRTVDALLLRVRVPAGSPGFVVDSDLLIDQLRAIDSRRFYTEDGRRLRKRIARAEGSVMTKVHRCLKAVLTIE